MSLKETVKTLVQRICFGHKGTEESYIQWLRKQGMQIGEHVHLYSPWTIKIDTQRPWMIEIGNNVHITADCSILQHDYSWAVLQQVTGQVFGSCGKVRIGNNVFIGQKSLILKGADIGDNIIIGAGSVVSKKLESNAVYAGVPARRLMSLDEFIDKRRDAQLREAVSLVHEYCAKYGQKPDKTVLREFFWLFEPRDLLSLNQVFHDVLDLDGQWSFSSEVFSSSSPMFDGYEAFLDYCATCEDGNGRSHSNKTSL